MTAVYIPLIINSALLEVLKIVLQKITEIIVNIGQCKAEDVIPEAELVALGIDSLKAINVLFELEEEFDVEIPNEVIPSIVTVNDILQKLTELRA